MSHWNWFLRAYYSDDVEPPKEPGGFAIEIGGTSREALAMDLQVLQNRVDIGEIVGPYEAVPR